MGWLALALNWIFYQLSLTFTHLATDEGLSIFCCELDFVCERCGLLLDLVTLFERPFVEEEKLNMVTKDRRGAIVEDRIEAPDRRERLNRGTRGMCK